MNKKRGRKDTVIFLIVVLVLATMSALVLAKKASSQNFKIFDPVISKYPAGMIPAGTKTGIIVSEQREPLFLIYGNGSYEYTGDELPADYEFLFCSIDVNLETKECIRTKELTGELPNVTAQTIIYAGINAEEPSPEKIKELINSLYLWSVGVQCTDSDVDSEYVDGRNYYVKGTLTYTNNPYGVLEEFDSCADDYYLIEGVCNSPTEYTENHEKYYCEYGCRDGACSPPSLCTDSDGGVNPFVKGVCEDYRGVKIEDICIEDYVSESFCVTEEMVEHCKQYIGKLSYITEESCENSLNQCQRYTLAPQIKDWIYLDKNESLVCRYGCKDGECISYKLGQLIASEKRCFASAIYSILYRECDQTHAWEFPEIVKTDKIQLYSYSPGNEITYDWIEIGSKYGAQIRIDIKKTVAFGQPYTVDLISIGTKLNQEIGDYIVKITVKGSAYRMGDGGIVFNNYRFCKDNESEANPFVLGEIISDRTTYTDECSDLGGEHLVDYYCEGNIMKNKKIFCNCENGVCKQGCETDTKYPAEGSVCSEAWPTEQGYDMSSFSTYLDNSCNIFEVCSAELDYVIDDAVDCCVNHKTDETCKFALENSDGNLKKCKGLYIIHALGTGAKYMKGYFTSELCCFGDEDCGDATLYGKCEQPETPNNLFYKTYINEYASQLPCEYDKDKPSWISDTDMKKNTNACYLAQLPAHVSLNILETGTCADYAIVLTTLLRKAGYGHDEAMYARGKYHAYNLVKFPGDDKYHIVDTTGNRPVNIDFNTIPLTFSGKNLMNERIEIGDMGSIHIIGYMHYDYCIMMWPDECWNDNGRFDCPLKSEIYGCGVRRKFTLDRCSFDLTIARAACDDCWYEYLDPLTSEACCRFKKYGVSYKKCIEFDLSERG